MHTGPVPGKYTSDWTQVGEQGIVCRICKSHSVQYRVWESDCGGYEDIHYKCKVCNHSWWVESSDS